MTTRSGSQADATAPSTAQLSPPSDFEEPEASAELDIVTDRSTVQQDVPLDQDPWSGLGARPKVFTDEHRQRVATSAAGRDRTSMFGTSVRATTKVAGPSTESTELELRRMDMEMEIRRMELEDREHERGEREREREREREERERDRQHQLELRRLELEAGIAGIEPAQSHSPPFRVDTAIKLIPKFNEHDIESFLISFEKIAQLNAFPKDKYAAVLQAQLTGKALKVFTELSVQQCQDYKTLKDALLTAYSVVPEVYRKRFRSMTMNRHETFSEFAFRLSTQFKRWLESENAYDKIEQLRELFMIEQFQTSIDTDLRMWLLDQRPKTLVETAKLADQYTAVHRASRVDRKPHDGKPKQFVSQSGDKPPASAPPTSHTSQKSPESHRKATSFPGNKVFCYYCKKPGHILANCRKRLAKLSGASTSSDAAPVQLISTVQCHQGDQLIPDSTIKTEQVVPVEPGFAQHCVTATLVRPDHSQKTVNVLRDTGALQSLVCSRVLSDQDYLPIDESRLIRGVTGDVLSVPLVQITLHSPVCAGTYLCGLVSTLPTGVAILLGNDLCPDLPTMDVNVVTRSQTAALKKQVESVPDVVTASVADDSPADLEPADDTSSDPVTDVSSLFEDSSNSSSLSFFNLVDRKELISLQQSDPDLATLFDLADQPDHSYQIRDGVLLRLWRDKCSPQEATFHQVVVPTPLRANLLRLAHEIPAAGHLGIAKTKDRLLRHFYWPSISRDTRNFCRSCDVCQRIGKGPPCLPAPLHSLPLMSEPFSQVAIDIVGPLPVCKESGNRFILTVLDLCTHYPEAIPLKRHTASDVAQALSTVFSRFGFPQEILSDQGTDFMSELMQIFLHDFGVNHIRTSPYHPQSNGACERFNGTLKSMLRSLLDRFPDSWDTALPWVLFAYREVPVETLGCSPFDLLFGRSVAGPLSLVKSSWLHETDLSTAKQNVVEFILSTRERLRHAVDLATEHATQQRTKAKRWYDRRAVIRTFLPGDKVLVLLPIPGKPLHAKFHGPYTVEEQLGPVDYVISTPDRRKTKRVCHVNLLKKYVDRDPTWKITVDEPPANVLLQTSAAGPISQTVIPSADSVAFDDRVTIQQQSDLKNLLDEYDVIFSDVPGKTTLGVHHIEVPPVTRPIRCTPYRLGPEKSAYLKKELADLVDLGIIEESSSPWASPIVMVPKADGKLRLCTDFRKVNAVTIPDPFPLPRIEDLIDRIGRAKFLTKLDMTRGYWQVPLDVESVPVSAFVTPFGHFQWRYMPFGLRNAPATFSRLVTKLLLGLESFCAAYLDDIIIFSDSWEEHLRHLRMVFDRIRDAHLTLSPSKCQFAVADVDYLGHHVGLGCVQPRAAKVEAVMAYPTPINRKQLQSFLGVAGYYRKFIPHYAHISAVLSDLLKKGVKFVWTPEADAAFLDLKSRLATRPILRPPDYSFPFCMAVDASELAIGASLFQVVDDVEHPICFYSKKLDCHQKRYSTIEKEALALVLAVRLFSVYFGTQPVKVFTDHSPLQFIQRMANHNQKLLRWSLELQQYNLEICHRAGRDNLMPDLLSRRPSVS